jgi:hypothetical protein
MNFVMERPTLSASEIMRPATEAAAHVLVVTCPGDESSGDSSGIIGVTDQAGTELARLPPPEEWTKELDREFRSLALRSASGAATPGEESRLRELQSWRRDIEHPLTGREVIEAHRRNQVMSDVHGALKRYFTFYPAARKAR